jgi:hydroxyethylthiazole kinase-like uncharacterized protein yjeF
VRYITPERMKELESLASSRGLGVGELMENAGRAVAEVVENRYGSGKSKKVLVVCGTGNNGGDGFVAARYLSQLGWKVKVVLLADPGSIKTAEARENWSKLVPPVRTETAPDAEALGRLKTRMKDQDVILDAIFGTGVRGEIREPAKTAVDLINLSGAAKVSIDIPSGVDPATGQVMGAAVRADLTVALHSAKTGLRGMEQYTGELIAVPIGIRERA